ncbi:MAG TPA: DUF948 domain-containing protein [Thermoleophilaceae bacterium]|nr:DUF948 domain-containing protein [Thermoleophilaceae bacterium]
MSPLLPKNPVGDVLKRVDHTLDSADASLARVDETLHGVEGTLAEATTVLAGVQDLLATLEDKLELLDQVPAVLAHLEEIKAAVAAGA